MFLVLTGSAIPESHLQLGVAVGSQIHVYDPTCSVDHIRFPPRIRVGLSVLLNYTLNAGRQTIWYEVDVKTDRAFERTIPPQAPSTRSVGLQP